MHKAHTLVVSENPAIRHVLRRILQQEGHDQVTTMQIREGASQAHPDLILLEVNPTSGARGWTVLQQLKRSSPTKDRPLLLCALALALLPERECWLKQQGRARLVKPVGMEQLLQAVSRALAYVERSEDHAIAWS